MDMEKVIKGLEEISDYFFDIYRKEKNGYSPAQEYCNVAEEALSLLKEQPEIVRCISCTFYRSDGKCALHNGKWRPDGFCSWAIRKEGR